MAAPRPRVDGSDTFFLGRRPDGAGGAARCPGSAEPEPLPPQRRRDRPRSPQARQAMGAPTVSGSMATAVLAYSGIAVKMLVDQRLDAQLHTMFMVDYQPGAVAHPHDHPFEESYYMLDGEVDVVANGDRYTLRPGDVFWTGGGLRACLLRDAGRAVRWLETSAPGPPARYSYRLERDWDYLVETLSSKQAPRSREPRQRQAGDGRARRPRALHGIYRRMLSSAASRTSCSRSSSGRGLRNDPSVLRAGSDRHGLRERARGPRPCRGHLPRAWPRTRRRRRSAEAARRDARRGRPASTGAGPAR